MYTDINDEDRLVQKTFADYLRDKLRWESFYAYNDETFGPAGTLGRADRREVVLKRDLRAAISRLNPTLPRDAVDQAVRRLADTDYTRSLVQHNREFYSLIRDGVPVEFREDDGQLRRLKARVVDFRVPDNNRFLVVRELWIQGLRTPNYNRRADLVCFVNGLPLVFVELKAVYRNVRVAYDGNLRDYLDENVVAHAFHHNAFLVVSNGDRARYGSITSQWEHFADWKRNDESEKGRLDAQVLLDGMLAKDRLLDLVENFILFDESRPGAVRKVVARNQQVLGVNRAVESVLRQERLKLEYPLGRRERNAIVVLESRQACDAGLALPNEHGLRKIEFLEPAHPELGKLGVFWHTQGSGKSYSMAFFAEKVRRTVPGNFTFVVMTDRHDLDTQIYETFAGCGIADKKTPRPENGERLREVLRENHRYVFSLIHKFGRNVDPREPYSTRDDIIVISDEAHRTQAGKLARNMRLALPNASFIGFTGTPIFDRDHLTKRIFGGYVSKYDFKRSEEDGATVKLVYDNRGEKLGLARADLNDRIADSIEQADLDTDEQARIEKLLGKDYEIITAPARLECVADDFVEHCSARWESGKAMLVCVDKVTCARMLQYVEPRWRAKLAQVRAEAAAQADADRRAKLEEKVRWMEQTIVELVVSEAQGEVAEFRKWDFDVIPHRALMKQGFETPDGKRIPIDLAFKDPDHPFGVAVVCAMWLTGFDVECLSTLYIDKPMKAHGLMQAIARANRRFPGKDCGVIVDYNGMLRALREALARYALGDATDGAQDLVGPVGERVPALDDALSEAEAHLRAFGFEPARLPGLTGFARIQALKDAKEAVCTTDESRRRFEVLAGIVFARFRSLVEPSVAAKFGERHDNIQTVFRKLSEDRDDADVTELLKALQRIVNEAVATMPSVPAPQSTTLDLSRIDFDALRREFARKVPRKATALQEVRTLVEKKLRQMLAANPLRMDFYARYAQLIAEYNREKDRVAIEDTFARLVKLAADLDEEQQRAAREGLNQEELALFDLLLKKDISQAERERVKQASRLLLVQLRALVAPMEEWTRKEQTQSDVRTAIADNVYALPTPPFTEEDKLAAVERAFRHVWQQSAAGLFPGKAA